MARIQETEVEPRDGFFEKPGYDGLEQRGRRFQPPMRHELNNKNIQFKGTIAANANEFLRSRSQMSRNSSTHSNTVGRRHHSTTTIPSLNNHAGYPSNKSLLSAYNEKTVSDTVLPVRTTKHSSTPQRGQLSSRHGSRNSSVHSFKKNYTFGSESLSNLRDRQESITGIPEDDDSEYRLDVEIRKRFNKAASISGPSGLRRALELKKSSLNHSFNASSNSSNYSDEDEDDAVNGMEVDTVPLSYESLIQESVENSTKKNLMFESTSPKSKPLQCEPQEDNKQPQVHDHPMRTLQRQMNIRDQALFKDKDEHEINELTQKWNSFISLDDKRMFEMITNDLRKIARYNQKPVVKSLLHCREHGYLKLNKLDATKPQLDKFDLTAGRARIRLFWSELNDTSIDQNQR